MEREEFWKVVAMTPDVSSEPPRIARLQHFQGIPIPWMMLVTDGHPDFKVLDWRRVVSCGENRLCGICAEKLGRYLWFVGGEQSCSAGRFVDPPFHLERAEYAFKICPYLLGRTGYSQAQPKIGETSKLIRANLDDTTKMGLYLTGSYTLDEYEGMIMFVAGACEEIVWRERKPE